MRTVDHALRLAVLLATMLGLATLAGCACGGGVGETCTDSTDCRSGLVCDPVTRTCEEAGTDAMTATDAVPGTDATMSLDSGDGTDATMSLDGGSDSSVPGTDSAPPGTDAAACSASGASCATTPCCAGLDCCCGPGPCGPASMMYCAAVGTCPVG